MWWAMILSSGSLVEQAGIDQPRHARGGLVRPAEGEPDLVLGRCSRGVIGRIAARASDGPRPAGRARPCLRKIGRYSGSDSGLPATLVKTWMPRAPSCLIARSISASARIDVVHRQRRDERGEAIRDASSAASASESLAMRAISGVISGPPSCSSGGLDERQHLLQAGELVQHPQPRVDVPEALPLGEGLHRGVVRDEFADTLERGPRHEVIEDVDHRSPPVALKSTLQTGR